MEEKRGRPIEYKGQDTINRVHDYIDKCVDEYEDYHKTRGEKSDSYERIVRVKLPSLAGLAIYLKVNRDTITDWGKKYPDFSVALGFVRTLQEQRLLEGGLSGDYNPTIAKLGLSTNHGYRDGIDQTTNGKDLPTPLLNVLHNSSNEENSQTQEEN